MKVGNQSVRGAWLQVRTRLRGTSATGAYASDEPPLRAELFSSDQMEQHGKALASGHALARGRARDRLLPRLFENEGILIGVCNLLTAAVAANRRIAPAGEWLLDNFYLIEEQIRTARRHFPPGYSRELPRLLRGASAGLPRVYDIALETISHGDGRVDLESLSGFLVAYQTVTALTLGELWAIPIMLRLALIENLRRVGTRLLAERAARNDADSWADQMTEIAATDPKSLILATADMARSNPPMGGPFVAEFTRRLQGQSQALALPLTWIEQRLSESGLTIEQLVQAESQQQAADQLSISNSIGSLRFLGALDWREFVETVSVVEQTLREDPADVYGKMDFATRDRYRHVVEDLAKRSRLSEGHVARTAIGLARESATTHGDGDRAAHVGFYLIDSGWCQLERTMAARRSSWGALRPTSARCALLLYLGAILATTAILAGALLLAARGSGMRGWMFALMGGLAVVGASHLAAALVNWLATFLATPHLLPRMDFSQGIPPESRTLVVIPTMLASAQGVEDLVEGLEVRFLGNRDANLHFALLTDFRDAHTETMPEDEPLLRLARDRIGALNAQYESAPGDRFFLFHRPRVWNPQERTWMGYERKRGKLEELNALLRHGKADGFSLVVGEPAVLSNVTYVITLDTDTQLPRDSAWQCVGAMAHPLNRPRYDETRRRVCEGYGILQPRVAVSLPGTNWSWYARLYGSEPGIDPYTRAVSDVYQDLFHEGSYIGKGIYDVEAFEQALAGRFPENLILSHDLVEGCYARSGLLSDVQVYEEYPSTYPADVSRRRRWIRGDWQVLRWAFPSVPGPSACRQRNPLSLLSRWKILDNVRRSLVPSALTLMFLVTWTVASPLWLSTLAVMGIILIPPWLASLLELFRKKPDVLLRQHLAAVGRSAGRHCAQAAFTLACLPYEAVFSLEAIARTVGRLLITRTGLLEWNPSGNPDRQSSSNLVAFCRTMWAAPVLAMAASLQLALVRPAALEAAGPLLGLWFAAPVIAWWLSRPLARRAAKLTGDQTVFLRTLSRKIWAFFETFVGPEDHWLPPDNVQESPVAAVGHRTSPTNMGLALLANLTAHDFGYIGTGQLLDRTAKALETMQGLERHHGHFYNWYDTRSLNPLPPLYVSSVDSGNLAGHLLTLGPGLLALPDQKILGARVFDGLRDTLWILGEAAGSEVAPQIARLREGVLCACDSPPTALTAARASLDRLAVSAAELVNGLEPGPERPGQWWAHALARQCQNALDDLLFVAPWVTLSVAQNPGSDIRGLDQIPTLREVATLAGRLAAVIGGAGTSDAPARGHERLGELRRLVGEASARASARIAALERLAEQCDELAGMEYGFLFDKGRQLLAIGYNVSERRRDTSYYDLLASEARLCNFVAIAQGQLPQESWFALGRLLTASAGGPVLLSWSGSMFEYLMPLLVMPTYERTLLDQTYAAAVRRQIEYGRVRRLPWGISESGYNSVDAHLHYQYRAFGVPGLGLKRGLAEDMVIAPYASALALMVAPEEACRNLQRLAADGLDGPYGLYEAIDYTPSRVPRGLSSVVVRSFMAHHQGMSLLALAYLLLERPMQKRFASNPVFRATTLLLQERVPHVSKFYSRTVGLSDYQAASGTSETPARVFIHPDTPIPEVQLLSNGRYHVMITQAGGGYSRWKDLAVTRWREDTTCDSWGMFCYLRDVTTGEVWSTAYQPTRTTPESYEAIFSEARAEFRRRDHAFETHTEIAVSPEDDIELRRIRITNRSRTRRTIEITSYAEVVLAPPAADALHPAFSNLFVQTEILHERQAILCTRRPRSLDEPAPWMFHLMAAHGGDLGESSYESDRMRFIGRGHTPADPHALSDTAPLSDSQGSVLDPIVAIRRQIALDPDTATTINLVSGMGETRDACLILIEKYRDRRLADRVFDLAWTHSQVVLRQLNATETDAQLYGRLAGSVLYANKTLRAEPGLLLKNRRGQSGLWGYAISGDLPIVLLQIGDPANIELVRQLVQAHAYWRLKGLAVDLVIWNEDHAGYRQLLQDQILGLIAAGIEANVTDRPGGIFVRPADQISSEDRILLQAVARAIVTDSGGSLAEQIARRDPGEAPVSALMTTRAHRPDPPEITGPPRQDLLFFNGLGGFTADGREYVIATTEEYVTPAPWANVLANPEFGTVISESGSAYSWSENAHEYRLTPWYNDPVSDAGGEAVYLRDDESGHVWSPTPLPSRGTQPYITRHGFGYSVFEHTEVGIQSELWVYVAMDAPIKFSVLKVRNESGRSRRLSATGYAEWVLGDVRPKSTMHVITELDAGSGALFARNPYNIEFTDRVAFLDVDATMRSLTGDRTEFLGRNGTMRRPASLARARLSGRVGAALDPCAAMQVPFELADGQEREIVFRLGVGRNTDDARSLARRFRGATAARGALEAVWRHWTHTLGAVHVDTPDPSLNVMANGWLIYQTLTCRLWARSGYYQSGGAFGFRDQLQDTMTLVHAAPQLTREHLLRAAARQFREGDVQHWWHPPAGRGVRTHCSDDYLWLPAATCRYVACTGDTGVLDEPVHFVAGRPVSPEEDSYYDLPSRSDETASLYDHCVRAVLRSLRWGDHGLPLIGSGDWNDGMNLVGAQGKGESVWLGFFLHDVLTRFAEVAKQRGDAAFAERCQGEATQLRARLEEHGWDGEWYRRAYFDDGAPLGSSRNLECQIDSIAQSWSVLSGAGDAERSRQAMEAVDRRLVRRGHGLIQLLDPPFNTSAMNPGYVRGYVPGVRENGGQYTHGAIWATMAFAALGDNRRAWELMAMLNPVHHGSSAKAIGTYKVEPYVVAADICALSPHTGRGGWTWYTGSSGWMYRLILESLLGLRREAATLRFAPCLPADWEGFTVHYRYRETVYHVVVLQTACGNSEMGVTLDGVEQGDNKTIPLVDDHQEHSVAVRVPRRDMR